VASRDLSPSRHRGRRPRARVRRLARNADAVRFFNRLGFDVIGHVELMLDESRRDTGDWRTGERLAGVDFRV
jgi:hypothetical protein